LFSYDEVRLGKGTGKSQGRPQHEEEAGKKETARVKFVFFL